MKMIVVSMLLIVYGTETAFKQFENGYMLPQTAKFLQMSELFALACCSRNFYNSMAKNIELCVNDDLQFFKNSCDQNLKGYGELENRLKYIGSNFAITKLENGNFEVRPMMNFGRNSKFVIIVGEGKVRAVGDQWMRLFDVELPGSELILSSVRENMECKFASVFDYPVNNEIEFSYVSQPRVLKPKLPFVKSSIDRKESIVRLSFGQNISITTQNIERLFRLYTNGVAETSVSVVFNLFDLNTGRTLDFVFKLTVFFSVGLPIMLFILLSIMKCLQIAMLSTLVRRLDFLDKNLPLYYLPFSIFVNKLSSSLNAFAYLLFLISYPLEGRVIHYIHKNSFRRNFVQGSFLLGFPILARLSFLYPTFMMVAGLAATIVQFLLEKQRL